MTPPISQPTTPTGHKPGTYFVKVWSTTTRLGGTFWRATVSRQGSALGFVRITGATGATAASAVSEARRQVRLARKCGGCK